MKTIALPLENSSVRGTPASSSSVTSRRLADYRQLVRPRVAVMVLVTVALGGWLASPRAVPPVALWHAVLGVGLVTAGASILNQYLERQTDRRMMRTRNRPLAARRLAASEVVLLGVGATVAGLTYMVATIPSPLPTVITAMTFAMYVFAYTPAKRTTTLNTLIGAVPGAMPPLIGWVAVTGRVDAGAVALFLIVFIWQVPHFLAIAWIYREDYGRAGLRMLTVDDPSGDCTAQQMLQYGLTLVPVSLWPIGLGLTSYGYAAGAVALAIVFLVPIWQFRRERSIDSAKRVMRASLIYLPGVLALLIVFKIW